MKETLRSVRESSKTFLKQLVQTAKIDLVELRTKLEEEQPNIDSSTADPVTKAMINIKLLKSIDETPSIRTYLHKGSALKEFPIVIPIGKNVIVRKLSPALTLTREGVRMFIQTNVEAEHHQTIEPYERLLQKMWDENWERGTVEKIAQLTPKQIFDSIDKSLR